MTPKAAVATASDPQIIDNFFIAGYGGVRLGNTLNWDDSAYDLAQGPAFGATFGVNTTIPGLSFDIDAMQANSYYSCCGTDDVLNSTTLMADINYTAPIADGFSVFAGAGVGALWLNYDNYEHGTAAAYQLKAGAKFDLTDQLGLFAEYKYQSAFGDVQGDKGDNIQVAHGTVLGGLQFTFK